MMGMSMASAPMTMQAGQMAYRPMVPMAPMTAMTAPYAANQPMNVRQTHFCLFVYLFVKMSEILFVVSIADDGFGYQAGNDGWTFFWRRWSFRHGCHDSAWHAHGF